MKALAFGEIIWDTYSDRETLGGAPLNVTGHICRLGGNAAVISAVGDDKAGRETIERISELEICTSYMTISENPTGRAFVTLENSIPSYTFNCPAAWDDIRLSDEQLSRVRNRVWDVFIFGTLAQRAEVSRSSLHRVLDSVRAKEIFFDVNLRLSYYSREILEYSLGKATIVKMNDEEVDVITKLLGAKSVEDIMERYDIHIAITTYGKNGTVVHEKGCKDIHVPAGNVPVVDTVGAGDSLSAAFLYFYTAERNTERAIRKASLLADYVVGERGAIPEYTEEIREKLFSLC